MGSNENAMELVNRICTTLKGNELDRKTKIQQMDTLINVVKSNPHLHVNHLPISLVYKTLRPYLFDTDTTVRATSLRIIKHLLVNQTAVNEFLALYLHVHVIRSIEREQKYLWERLQAIKVVGQFVKTDSLRMPTGIVRSLVSVALHKDDNCRRVCLELLRNLVCVNTAIVAKCDGIRLLVDAVLNPTYHDSAKSIILTLIFLLNEPMTRQYMRPFTDLRILLAPFTETDVPAGAERRQRWDACRSCIVLLMRTWPGIITLTSDPQGGLRSLVKLLEQPVGIDVKKAILSTVFEIFYLPEPFYKNSTTSPYTEPDDYSYQTKLDASKTSFDISSKFQAITPHNLLANYTIFILLAFINCGLLDALVKLGVGTNTELARPSTYLLGELLRLASVLLPKEHCARLLALPALVEGASSVSLNAALLLKRSVEPMSQEAVTQGRSRSIRSAELLSELAEAIHFDMKSPGNKRYTFRNGVHMASVLLRGTNRPMHQIMASNANKASMNDCSGREYRAYVLKASMDLQMDDVTFKDMLYQRSRVLLGKDWFKWDWDVITELLEGPLTNPNRLSEAMKTKFFKRLSGFFRCDPGNKGYFAQLPWIPDYVPYIRPACRMYTLLLNHPDGLHFLKTDRRGQLLSEIATALELESRPEAAIVESHIGALQARMFSPEFCSRRMLREYFTLLGLMSSSPEGLRLLEASNLFNRLYLMGKMQGHDFLCRLILANLDYTVNGSSRTLLQLWMTDGSKPLRLYATCLLRALLRSDMADFKKWGIDILVTQLFQEDEVANAALSVLEEAAQTPQYLLAMINKRPQMLMSLPNAKSLLLRFVSLPEGLSFLEEMNWMTTLLDKWRREEYLMYVNRVESALRTCLTKQDILGQLNSADESSSTTADPVPILVSVPQHKGGPSNVASSSKPWGLEWLFRLPWNMEVKIVGPSGSGPPTNLTLDTFVDASHIGEGSNDHPLGSDHVKVKGIVVDARNMPSPVIVTSQQTLQACLFLGTQPIDRHGCTKPHPQGNGGFILSYQVPVDGSAMSSGMRGRTQSAPADKIRYQSSDATHDGPSGEIYSSPIDAEEHKDWSYCRPEHRGSNLKVPESRVCARGERALWTFKVEKSSDEHRSPRAWLKSVEFTLQLLPHKPLIVSLPYHLYGELAKTNAGCGIMRNSGHIPEFIQLATDPATVPLQQRAALWALGHVAGTSRGFEMIRRHADDIVDVILKMATSSSNLSLRGTCFYVLGLISRSAPGRRALVQANWSSPRNQYSTATVPNDPTSLFAYPEEEFVGSPAVDLKDMDEDLPLPQKQDEWDEILKLLSNLSNHITQKEAHSSLTRLKASQKTAQFFRDPRLRLHAIHLMAKYSYRLPVRQFIHNLFDKASLGESVWESVDSSRDVAEGIELAEQSFTRGATIVDITKVPAIDKYKVDLVDENTIIVGGEGVVV